MYLNCKILNNTNDFIDITNVCAVEKVAFQQIINDETENRVKLNGHIYQKNLLVLEGETLLNKARKSWKSLECMIINDRLIPQTMANEIGDVINLLLYTAHNLTISKDSIEMWNFQKELRNHIAIFKRSIANIRKLGNRMMNKLSSNSITLSTEPICKYFHFYISVIYITFYIDCLFEPEESVNIAKPIIMDLVMLSLEIYNKNQNDILNKKPFPCLCVKKFWLYLRHNLKHKFWDTFNEIITNQDEEFTIWLLYHISTIELYNSDGKFIGKQESAVDNNELLVKLLQNIISKWNNDKKVLDALKIINSLLSNVWVNRKLEPYQILWEYYYKNLETTRDVAEPKSVNDLMNLIDKIQNSPTTLESSYEYFIYMLCNHLNTHPAHWNKMRGRIYSRLPPQKMNDYNVKAILQISTLFMMLSHVNVKESLEKLHSLLECLTKEKLEHESIWIILIGITAIGVKQNQDIKKISSILRKLCDDVALHREKYHLLKHYVTGVDFVMNINTNYNLGQSALLGSWIIPYMSSCAYSDLYELVNNFTCLIVQVENCEKWYEFKLPYMNFVLPALKKIISSNNVPPQIGVLVGKICVNIPEIKQPTLQYFFNNCTDVKITYQLLTTIMGNNEFSFYSNAEENLLITSWFRICILNTDEPPKELSNKIFNLSTIKTVLTINNMDEDPYTNFVKNLNSQLESQTNLFRLKELCEICFGNVDQWLVNYLTPCTSETQVIYLYTTISSFFYLCSPLLYNKSKSNCLFHRLVTLLLLPTDVLMGKSPPNNVLNAIKKTWHLFVKGVLKLNPSSDPYVDRTLKDLVIRYIPHFPFTQSPILQVLDDDKLSSIIYEKISQSFLLKSARSTEENTFKAVKTIQNVLEHTHDERKIKIIIEKILLGVLEVIMFTNQKNAALELIKLFISAGWYNQIQTQVLLVIQAITDKHLAFNSANYFQLIGSLINVVPSSVRSALPHIKKQITHVERMRGVGFDNTLRLGLDRIEKALS